MNWTVAPLRVIHLVCSDPLSLSLSLSEPVRVFPRQMNTT